MSDDASVVSDEVVTVRAIISCWPWQDLHKIIRKAAWAADVKYEVDEREYGFFRYSAWVRFIGTKERLDYVEELLGDYKRLEP